MRVALIDDEIAFHKIFISTLRQNNIQEKIDCYTVPEEFLSRVTAYDAIFLDIDFGCSKSGIELASRLKLLNNSLIIIFVTAHSEIVYDAFGINVLAFLNKQDLDFQIKKVWLRLRNEISSRKKLILEMTNGRTFAIEISKILFCDIALRKIRLVDDEEHVIFLRYRRLSDLYSLFEDCPFVYINRSCFVNIQKVESFGSGKLHFKESSISLDYSRDKYHTIKQAFINYNAAGSVM